MTDMNQQFLNHFVDKGTGVKDGETWHGGAEKAAGVEMQGSKSKNQSFL